MLAAWTHISWFWTTCWYDAPPYSEALGHLWTAVAPNGVWTWYWVLDLVVLHSHWCHLCMEGMRWSARPTNTADKSVNIFFGCMWLSMWVPSVAVCVHLFVTSKRREVNFLAVVDLSWKFLLKLEAFVKSRPWILVQYNCRGKLAWVCASIGFLRQGGEGSKEEEWCQLSISSQLQGELV